MRIKIALKLRPFSHRPGMRCLIPFTTWEVQAFPALLKFQDLETGEKKEIALPAQGPVKGFTVLQDLERERVEVFGRGKEGYFRHFITPENFPHLKKEDLAPSSLRLSFGVHKKQDWDNILRRCDMKEVFPFWVRLAQLIPERPLPQGKKGVLQLLDSVENGLLFQAGFQGILSPRLSDQNHLGIVEEAHLEGTALGLLHEGARQILRLFFKEEKNVWQLLPNLPKEFHAGRIITLQTTNQHRLDFEWSKKKIKKVIVYPSKDDRIGLALKKGIKSYRLRKSLRQKGERVESKAFLTLKKGQILYLDRFMA